MPPTKDAHLYGAPRPSSKKPTKEITSSSNLSFNTALSSLISSSTALTASSASNSSTSTSGRARPSKNKPDIFSQHNKNSKKRAAADMLDSSSASQVHKTTAPGEGISSEEWRRAKRSMAEKARLYAAMKRGEVMDEGERYSVDFDAMWAAKHGSGGSEANGAGSESEDDEESESEDEQKVEYVDEFGRTRTGSRKEAQRNETQKQRARQNAAALEESRARPMAPANIIHGDTIQAEAFTEGADLAAMAAKGRDREMTPPEEKHYDAGEEVRTRGTGFFKFSGDEKERKEQMDRLEKTRLETEKARGETGREGVGSFGKADDDVNVARGESERLKDRRNAELEERRRLIREKRGQIQANKFLESLEGDLLGGENRGGNENTGGDVEPIVDK